MLFKSQVIILGSKYSHSNPDSSSFHFFKVLSSRIHKNAAGVNGLKPPELYRDWQFIIQQGFHPTQFSFFLFANNRVFRVVCGFRLSPSPAKLYSQMYQYLLGNHIYWQKKLFAFSEDQARWSGTERWKYLDRKKNQRKGTRQKRLSKRHLGGSEKKNSAWFNIICIYNEIYILLHAWKLMEYLFWQWLVKNHEVSKPQSPKPWILIGGSQGALHSARNNGIF